VRRLFGDSAAKKLLARKAAVGVFVKLRAVEVRCLLHQRRQAVGLLLVALELSLALGVVHRQLHARLLGEVARDFRKGFALDVHQEREHVA